MEKLVCRKCLEFGDTELASNGKPMCEKCIKEPIPVIDQNTCQHSIRFGITNGTCTKCHKYFEKDQALQPSEAELSASMRVNPYAKYEDDNYWLREYKII